MKKIILLFVVFLGIAQISQAQLNKSLTARAAYDTLVSQNKLDGKEIMSIFSVSDTSKDNGNVIDLQKGTAYNWIFMTKSVDPLDTKAYFYIVQVMLNLGIVFDFEDDSDDYSVYPVLGTKWLNSDDICKSIPLDGEFYAFYIPNKENITNLMLNLMPTNMGTIENPDSLIDVWLITASVSENKFIVCSYNANTGESLSCEEQNGTSVSQLSNKLPVSIYPNPSSGLVKLNLPIFGKAKIQVINNYGEIMFEDNTEIKDNYELNLHSFPNGIYTIKISEKDKIYSQKVILLK